MSSLGYRYWKSIKSPFYILSVLLCLFLLTLFPLLPALAEPTNNTPSAVVPSPQSRQATDGEDRTPAMEWFETTLVITYVSPIHLIITGEFNIHEIYLPTYGQTMTADGIRKQYEMEASPSQPNPPIKYTLLNKIDELFETLLNQTYPGSIRVIDIPRLNTSTLYNLSADENHYDPPVKITHYCSFLLVNNSAYFNAEELAKYDLKSTSNLLEGSLKQGATVTSDLMLFANAGHMNKYIIKVRTLDPALEETKDQLIIEHPSTELSIKDKSKVQFTLDNTYGINNSVKRIYDISFRISEPNIQTREKVQIDFDIDIANFDNVLINDSIITINSINLKHMNEKLPSNISDIPFMSTDGIRLFYDNGIINLSDLESEIDAEVEKIESELQDAFNSTKQVQLYVTWNLSSLVAVEPLYYLSDTGSMKRMGSQRPIIGYIYSTALVGLEHFENVSSKTIEGLLNAGAAAELDLSIKTNYKYSYDLTLPSGFVLKNLDYSSGSRELGYTFSLAPNQLRDIVIVSEYPAQYASSQANLEVRIDFHDVEILSFSDYQGSVKIEAHGVLHHIKLDPGSRFAKALPKGVIMEFYNSDAMRLLYSEDMLNLDEIREDMYAIIEENISRMLDEDLRMRVDFDSAMLTFDGDVSNMDDSKPVTFQISASGKMKITEKKLVKLGGFVTKQVELPLTAVKNWNVKYIFILPQYIDILGTPWVDDTDSIYSGPDIEQRSDGRYQLELTIYAADGNNSDNSGTSDPDQELEVVVNMEIDLTIWFFLSKIVIPIILSIILLCSIISITLIRRHKNKKLRQLEEDEEFMLEEDSGSYSQYPSTSAKADSESKDDWSYSFSRGSKDQKHFQKDKRKLFDRGLGLAREDPELNDYSSRLRELAPGIAPGGKKRVIFRKRELKLRIKNEKPHESTRKRSKRKPPKRRRY